MKSYVEDDWITDSIQKANEKLSWRPVWDVGRALEVTIGWYREYHENGVVRTHNDLVDYVNFARERGAVWTA